MSSLYTAKFVPVGFSRIQRILPLLLEQEKRERSYKTCVEYKCLVKWPCRRTSSWWPPPHTTTLLLLLKTLFTWQMKKNACTTNITISQPRTSSHNLVGFWPLLRRIPRWTGRKLPSTRLRDELEHKSIAILPHHLPLMTSHQTTSAAMLAKPSSSGILTSSSLLTTSSLMEHSRHHLTYFK